MQRTELVEVIGDCHDGEEEDSFDDFVDFLLQLINDYTVYSAIGKGKE